jgi:hypothetical protein
VLKERSMKPQYKTFGEAIDAALEWLRVRGVTRLDEAFEARMGAFGMRTSDGRSGYRLEFDSRSGAHINVWHHKVRGPHFTFQGNERDVQAKWRQLYWWNPRLRRRSNTDSYI